MNAVKEAAVLCCNPPASSPCSRAWSHSATSFSREYLRNYKIKNEQEREQEQATADYVNRVVGQEMPGAATLQSDGKNALTSSSEGY